MSQTTTSHYGPSVVLPNGNIAIASMRDSLIYILDMTTFRLLSLQLGRDEHRHVTGGTLFYSLGYLVLVTRLVTHHGPIVGTVLLWKLQEDNQGNVCSIQFHSQRLVPKEDIVVARNGKMYVLRHQQVLLQQTAATHQEQIEVYDVASGNLLNTIDVDVQNNTSIVRRSLFLSDSHLLLIRSRTAAPDEPGVGNLGIRSFRLVENDLVETCFLQSFQDGQVLFNTDTSKQLKTFILYRKETRTAQLNRMISINGDGILQEESDEINFGTRCVVTHQSSARRVFVENPDNTDGGIIKLDEFDLATNTVVRTLSTGLVAGQYRIDSVHSTDKEVVCILRQQTQNHENFIQSFAL
jgi:hypothetical protein